MGHVYSGSFPFLVFMAFVLAVALLREWRGRIRPMFIPRAEIERAADELSGKYGDFADEMAFAAEDRAWRYSNAFEQGRWRRVRKELERRRGL